MSANATYAANGITCTPRGGWKNITSPPPIPVLLGGFDIVHACLVQPVKNAINKIPHLGAVKVGAAHANLDNALAVVQQFNHLYHAVGAAQRR